MDCRRPIAIDLFAGVGGFSLGIEQAGFDVLVAIERDPIHAAAYAFNFPQTQVLCADITTLSGEEIKQAAFQLEKQKNSKAPGKKNAPLPLCPSALLPAQPLNPAIDLVIGGPPCQGFSVMGKGYVDDERNDLVFHFCRLVSELQPRYFVMENVPGMVTKRYAELLGRLIEQFETAGYCITQPVGVLNAADFGVPQQRKRLFLLGSRAGEPLLFYPKPPDLRRVTVRDAIADLPDLDNFEELWKTDEVMLADSLLQSAAASASRYARQMHGLDRELSNLAYPRTWNCQILTSCRRTHHKDDCIQRFYATLAGQLEPISRLRRLDWDGLCHTLRAGTGSERGRYTSPRPLHPTRPRVISVREAARLHSFPDWFRFHTTKWHGFRQVGNAVPPLLAQAVGQQVVAALGIMPSMPIEPIALGNPQLLRLNPSEATHYWQNSVFNVLSADANSQ